MNARKDENAEGAEGAQRLRRRNRKVPRLALLHPIAPKPGALGTPPKTPGSLGMTLSNNGSMNQGFNSFLKTLPSFMTKRTCSRRLMSCKGSPWTAMMSA